jgi:hypothetical protein
MFNAPPGSALTFDLRPTMSASYQRLQVRKRGTRSAPPARTAEVDSQNPGPNALVAKKSATPTSARIAPAVVAEPQDGLGQPINFCTLAARTRKSRIAQAVGQNACVLGHRVRYTTSGELLVDLKASLADQTLPERVRYYAGFDLLIVDEFGFDKIERDEAPQAANLFYKIIDARYQQRSTALITNIDFDAWAGYLGDPPLAMALLDRLVDGAIIVKITGKSYRAARARNAEAG